MIKIPRRKQKIKYSRKQACKYLTPMGDLSNSLQPLCYCPERDLVLGRRAYVCQVCYLYSQVNRNIPEIYEESRKLAEKKIKEKKLELEEFELEEIKGEDEIDLTIDEFEEEDEEVPTKFEKRKAGKEDMEGEDFAEVECPFCGELFDDLLTHIKTCEFAPDDASIEDVLPKKSKKKKKRTTTTEKSKAKTEGKGKQKCPYCGKEFQRLGRHITTCPKRPSEEESDEEEDTE
ncbi:MAG: hypothetical protein ACFFA8_08490 [Promethearchaeota archaeon]